MMIHSIYLFCMHILFWLFILHLAYAGGNTTTPYNIVDKGGGRKGRMTMHQGETEKEKSLSKTNSMFRRLLNRSTLAPAPQFTNGSSNASRQLQSCSVILSNTLWHISSTTRKRSIKGRRLRLLAYLFTYSYSSVSKQCGYIQ